MFDFPYNIIIFSSFDLRGYMVHKKEVDNTLVVFNSVAIGEPFNQF